MPVYNNSYQLLLTSSQNVNGCIYQLQITLLDVIIQLLNRVIIPKLFECLMPQAFKRTHRSIKEHSFEASAVRTTVASQIYD